MDVGDEARGPGSVGRGFSLPPDAAFILYVLSAWVPECIYPSKSVEGRISDSFPLQISCPDNLMVDV